MYRGKLISESMEETSKCLESQQFIYTGDSRRLREIVPASSVQSVVTSPPYWGLRTYGVDEEVGAESTLEEYLENISNVFGQCREALNDSGTLWLIIGDCYTSGNRKYRHADKKHAMRAMVSRPKNPPGLKNKDLIGLPWRVAFRLQADGWYLRSSVIWHKTNPIPESVADRPHQSHEYIFLFSKSEKYFFNQSGLDDVDNAFKASRNVWSTSVNSGIAGHSAPFPVDLISPCVRSSTVVGDIVLDPFAGSGTVGLACKILNRNFFGIELFEENTRRALDRLG